MLTSHKQVPQFSCVFPAYKLHEIFLQGIDVSNGGFELENIIEISPESIDIGEIQIGGFYLCL
jgi:hypothetical protein